MAKRYGWEETTFSVQILGETFSLIGSSNAIMVVFFLSGINLYIFLLLNPAIYRIGKAPNILRPRCNKQDESQSPFYLLLQDFQNYSRRI